MHRMNFFGALLLVASVAVPQTPRGADRPNLVVILVDDLRWDALSATGHPFVRSPNIERLAQEGALFRNAFVTTPLCSPSRASFLTGQYARAHGVSTNASALSPLVATSPSLLENGGYDTAFIGKWHMGNDDTPRPGFTHWVSFRGQGSYRDPELNINGEHVPTLGYLTDVLNHYAVDFVRTAARGFRPFLLYLSHKAVHGPPDPPDRHTDLYRGAPVPCSPGCQDTLKGKPALTLTKPPSPGDGLSDEAIRKKLRLLKSVDEGVGRILRTLAQEGVLDQTAVILTSDNGFFLREHGLRDKRWAYEEAIRIPLLVRYPPLTRPGARIDQIVLNVDLAPTLLELGGVPVPAEVHGRSFLPLLKGKKEGWRDMFAAEYFRESRFPRTPTWEALRTERWKYIRYPELGMEYDELYNLRSDPYELRNVVNDMRLTDLLERLRKRLTRLLTFPPRAAFDDSALSSSSPVLRCFRHQVLLRRV